MSERPQAISEHATPDEWLRRLEIFRERFRLGLIDETKFKEISRAFQFTDNLGHLWMPGATTNQWYRWDRTKWTVATPPQQLTASKMPVAIALAWNRQLAAPIELKATSNRPIDVPPPEPPRIVPEIRAPKPIVEIPTPVPKQNIAAPIEAPPVPMKPAPIESAPTPVPTPTFPHATCPHCNQSYIAPAKFCPHCGNLIEGAPKKPGRPTDLPERGTTRSRAKPKDLPR